MFHSKIKLLAVSISVLAAMSGRAALAPRADNLRCEYRQNPIGISVEKPRLSWMMLADDPAAHGLKQTAYRILVASNSVLLSEGKGDLWDTGVVQSAVSIQIPYAGSPVPAGARAFWKVQIWDGGGKSLGWSKPAVWSRGLDAGDWKAKWIGLDESQPSIRNDSPFRFLIPAHWISPAANSLQTELAVPGDAAVTSATAVFGADPGFTLTINGKLVGHGEIARSPNNWDIARFLQPGVNSIVVTTDTPRPGSPAPAVIGAVHVERKNTGALDIVTNAQWASASTDRGAYGVQPWGEVGYEEARLLPGRMLRKEFATRSGVARATAYVCGLGLSELYLNGSKVGDQVLSPNLTDYDKRVQYVTYDITAQLKPERNAIGLNLGNGRYWAPRDRVVFPTRNFGYPKALVQVGIEYLDGTREQVVSDESWKLTTDGPVRSNNEYDGEHYDARAEQTGWAVAGFDDSKWLPAKLVTGPTGVLIAQDAEPMRVVETVKPIKVTELRPGVFLYDMGQNMVGWCRLHVSGPRGASVTLRHAETVASGEIYTANLRSAEATDVYTLKGNGKETWEPRFTYHGFRYVEMQGFPGTPNLQSLEGRVVQDSMEPTADFTSSDAMLNKIHHNVFWGVRGNYRSIPTDCPQRDERQGWLGDRSVVCRSESYLFNVGAFYSKWERDIADAQTEAGGVPDVAPNYWRMYNDDVTWPSTFAQIPAMLYDQYADLRVIEGNYDSIKRWVAHTGGYLKDGILGKDTYADWCVPPEDPRLVHSKDPSRQTSGALLSTAYFYRINRQMARFARLLGKTDDATAFDSAASQIEEAFNKLYYHPETGFYGNGTQTANILPLAFGLVAPENRPRVIASLVDNIENKSSGHVATGLVGAQWLMRTLTDVGRPDLAFKIATQQTYPGWGYMVSEGATTVWELWNGNTAEPSMNSGNHVMQIGDLGLWMYEDLAGIRADPDHPGFQHVLLHPHPISQLSSVKASHKTLYGTVQSEWQRSGETLHLNVSIPPNTTGTVWVPGAKAETQHPASARLVRMDGTDGVFEIDSGAYSFNVPDLVARTQE